MVKHKVRKGDTLGRIARLHYGDPSRYPLIVAANVISDPDRLPVGRELIVPDAATALRAVTPAPPPPDGGIARSPTGTLNEERLSRVHPILASRARSMIELCALSGVSILVTQGVRNWEEQDALYAKGRSTPPLGRKYFVTFAKGGESWHNFGLALDIVVLNSVGKADWDTNHPGWRKAAEVGKSLGLEWGGDWKKLKDLPHFQYIGDLSLPTCRELYPSGLPAIWQRVT
jgi:hypothetical protein